MGLIFYKWGLTVSSRVEATHQTLLQFCLESNDWKWFSGAVRSFIWIGCFIKNEGSVVQKCKWWFLSNWLGLPPSGGLRTPSFLKRNYSCYGWLRWLSSWIHIYGNKTFLSPTGTNQCRFACCSKGMRLKVWSCSLLGVHFSSSNICGRVSLWGRTRRTQQGRAIVMNGKVLLS